MIWNKLSSFQQLLNRINIWLFGEKSPKEQRKDFIDQAARRIVEKENNRPKVFDSLAKQIDSDNEKENKRELKEYAKARESRYLEIFATLLAKEIKKARLDKIVLSDKEEE